MGAVHHFQEVVIVDSLLQPLANGLELLELDHSVFVVVEDGEHLLEPVLGLDLAYSGANDVKVLVEGDGSLLVPEGVDEIEDEGVPAFGSQGLEGLGDFFGVDAATVILVEDLEGFLEIVVVILGDSILPG